MTLLTRLKEVYIAITCKHRKVEKIDKNLDFAICLECSKIVGLSGNLIQPRSVKNYLNWYLDTERGKKCGHSNTLALHWDYFKSELIVKECVDWNWEINEELDTIHHCKDCGCLLRVDYDNGKKCPLTVSELAIWHSKMANIKTSHILNLVNKFSDNNFFNALNIFLDDYTS